MPAVDHRIVDDLVKRFRDSIMRFVEGTSKRALARVLDVPESTLRTSFVKALKVLRSGLDRNGMAPREDQNG